MAFTADEAIQLLTKAHANDRISHAYLITGPEGCGKRTLAAHLAGLIVGRQDSPLKHPDVHTAEPESKSRKITVEQTRELERSLQMRSSAGGKKVAIIFDADRLQEQAANAFLKTLEEPPANSHMLLLSANPDQLLETILSRCIEVPLKPIVRREPNPLQRRLLEKLRSFSKITAPDLPHVFSLVREFQALLAEVKDKIAEETEEALKTEQKLYKQTTDATGDWFESRKAFFAALTESRYRNERSALIDTLEQWWGDILRQQQGGDHLDFPEHSADTAAIAGRMSVPDALRRAEAVAAFRENSGRNVQEQLAIEVAFIETFAA